MFSDRESKVIKILGKKPMTLKQIAEKLFKDKIPMDANIMVSNSVSRINKKCHFNKEGWTLEKLRGKGNVLLIHKTTSGLL